MSRPFTPLAVRLWRKIDVRQPEDCWPWLAGCDNHGYGQLNDRASHRVLKAHRAVYEDVFGVIPAGLGVLHGCDNPPCCNPNHLYLGTQAENLHDMAVADRANSGERCNLAHIPDHIIICCMARMLTGRETAVAIAAALGVSDVTVRSVWKGKQRQGLFRGDYHD
jgi:hypothetical protein